MKRFFFSIAFPVEMAVAALMGLVFVTATASPQTANLESQDDGSVVTMSVLSHRFGQDSATKNTSITMLRPPRGAPPRTFARSTAPKAQRYFIIDLGTLGGTQSFAYAINDSGQVAGSSLTTGDTSSHSFLYNDGKMTDLYPFNSQSVTTVGPTGINNAGQLASGLVVNGVYVPAILNSGIGGLTVIGSLGGVTSSGFNGVATAINNLGNAVGYSYVDAITRHAFLYSNSVMTDIGSFGGYSAALAINDGGVIVGFAADQYKGVAHAFVYTNGVMTDIVPDAESYARAVNNRSQVVGEFLTANQSAFHAFLYSRKTLPTSDSQAFPSLLTIRDRLLELHSSQTNRVLSFTKMGK